MDMTIHFHDSDRVEARKGETTIVTDQDGSAPAPFDLFLASIGTCAGFYVSRFCRQRKIPVDRLRIVQRSVRDPETRVIERIELEVELPPDFPAQYREAVIRSANLCAVKRYLEKPPKVGVVLTAAPEASAVEV